MTNQDKQKQIEATLQESAKVEQTLIMAAPILMDIRGVGSFSLPIPGTDPVRYVAAGTLAEIERVTRGQDALQQIADFGQEQDTAPAMLPPTDLLSMSGAGNGEWCGSDSEALEYLKPNFTDTAGLVQPKVGYGPTPKDFSVINYLCNEWDYAYVPEPRSDKAEHGKFAERLYGKAPSVDERRDSLYTMAMIFAKAETDSAREACFEDMYQEFLAVPHISIFDGLTRHTGIEISTNYTFENEEFFEVEAVEAFLADAPAAQPAPVVAGVVPAELMREAASMLRNSMFQFCDTSDKASDLADRISAALASLAPVAAEPVLQVPAEPSRAARIECALRHIIEADDAQALDQDLIEAGRSALDIKAPRVPTAAEVRAAALEEAAQIVIRRTSVPSDLLGAPTVEMKARAANGARAAEEIRALAAAPSVEVKGEQGEMGGGV